MRRRRIYRFPRKYGLIFPNGALDVVLCKPEIAQAPVQVFVQGIDVIQAVQGDGGIRGTAGFHKEAGQLLECIRITSADLGIMLQFLDSVWFVIQGEKGVGAPFVEIARFDVVRINVAKGFTPL